MATQPPDLDAARRLADDLSKKLGEMQAGGPRLAELRAEVEELRNALRAPSGEGEAHSWIAERMRALESLYEHAAVELKADGFKAGEYVAEIGRILGVR